MQILETKYLDDIVLAVVGHLEYRDSTDARTISSGVWEYVPFICCFLDYLLVCVWTSNVDLYE